MLNFQARLINVKFDKENRNVLRFSTREAQQNYFDVASLFVNAPFVNFNAGSLLETTIIYNIENGASINDILSKNYCIIKDNTPNATLPYYYYYVENSMQDSGGQIKVRLKLDIFQTYYIDADFTPCHINRAHLNRFVDIGNSKVAFNGSLTSPLFEREDIKNVGKRLTSRQIIKPYPKELPDTMRQWLEDNVSCWLYIYVDPQQPFKLLDNDLELKEGIYFSATEIIQNDASNTKLSGTSTRLCAICLPIFKNNNSSIIAETSAFLQNTKYVIDNIALQYFMDQNNGMANFFSMKISNQSPFNYLPDNIEFEIDNTTPSYSYLRIKNPWGLTSQNYDDKGELGQDFVFGSSLENGMRLKGISNGGPRGPAPRGLFYVKYQQPSIDINLELTQQYEFDKIEIVGAIANKKFNPKLLNADYASLKIGTQTSGFEYDLQKLNGKDQIIKYSEPLNPDISKIYTRLKGKEDNIYSPETDQNFMGDITSNDLSLTLATTQYQNMLANNKNYFLQNSINRGVQGAQSAMNVLGSFMSGNILGGIASGISSGINIAHDYINQQLTIDNMKAAPTDIQNASGNVLLNMMASSMGIVVETYEILENEKEIVNDYLMQYGFTFNKMGSIKNYDNVRKYYNYIAADIEEIRGVNISNAVYEAFKQAFARGVRFWNVDTFTYDLENYENWLEEEQNA